MNIKINRIKMENFCGTKEAEVNLFDRTIVKGVNKVGKTTLSNAIFSTFFNKLADGTSADDKIRPHDENGQNVDFVEINTWIDTNFDDKNAVFHKKQIQNYVTDRTTQEQKFKGNVNEFEINDIPKKEKDYVDYISQFIDLDRFMFCMNPKMFFNLDTKKRRALLFSLVGDVTDADVIKSNKDFEPLEKELMDGTVEELLSRCTKAIKQFEEMLKTIPARIDELVRQKVEVDATELKKQKANIESLIAEEHNRLSDIDSVNADYYKLAEDVSATERAMLEVKLKAKGDYESQKNEINRQIQSATIASASINSSIKADRNLLANYEKSKTDYESSIEKFRDDWTREKALEFDENEQKCPLCGTKYSANKIGNLKEEFEAHKTKTLANIEHLAKATKENLESVEKNIEEISIRIAEAEKTISDNDATVSALQEKISKLKEPDATKTKEYKDLEKKFVELTKKKESFVAPDKSAILNSINELNAEKSRIDVELSKLDKNADIDARIEDLKESQINVSQSIANQQKMMDLLKAYNRAKISMLTDKINSYFEVIKWQMFKEQINGGFAEVCIPLVEGTSYDGLLNHGNKILAEIDLCKAFQKASEVTCPIIIDDSESLDEWRIPQTDGQLIILRRTDDKVLTVEEIK